MIWMKKNGISRPSLLVGVVSSLILSVLFSFFGFTSRSYADSQLLYNSGGFRYSSNYLNGPWTSYWSAQSFTGQHAWDYIVGPNGQGSDDYSLYQYRYQGIGGGWVKTTTVQASGEYASISGQFNIVCMGINDNLAVVPFCDPYNARNGSMQIDGVTDLNATQIFQLESQNVSVSLTNWDWNDVPVYHVNLKNWTITVYFDIVIKVPQNFNGGFNISYSYPNGSFVYVSNPDKSYRAYYESGSATVSFSDDRELALLQQQNSILNRQLALQEQQYQQDQQDRDNISNRSDESQSSGNSASQNANSATSSLLGAITSIYDQLLHPHTTNCVIQGVQIYEMNLGNLDFCTGFDIPQPVFAIGALIMIGLIILLAWSILKAGISLYNEILGGKG